jgi:hypothetical protein
MQNVISHSQKKSKKLKTVVSGHQELAALEKCLADEKTKNCSLEKASSELREQLEVQKKAYQEQLKEQKRAHQGKPLLPSSTCICQFIEDSEKLCTAELRKILMYIEELLTDVKNLLYRCTNDIERLQKVIGDTEQQFVDCLQQIKTLGEKDERRQKELEDLRGAAQELVDLRGAAQGLVDMVDPPEEGEANPWPLLE